MSPFSSTCEVCGKIVPGLGRHCDQHPARSKAKQAQFRIAVLGRDQRCRFCGATEQLVAAHWPVPLRALPAEQQYDPVMGVCMCRDCHARTDKYAS